MTHISPWFPAPTQVIAPDPACLTTQSAVYEWLLYSMCPCPAEELSSGDVSDSEDVAIADEWQDEWVADPAQIPAIRHIIDLMRERKSPERDFRWVRKVVAASAPLSTTRSKTTRCEHTPHSRQTHAIGSVRMRIRSVREAQRRSRASSCSATRPTATTRPSERKARSESVHERQCGRLILFLSLMLVAVLLSDGRTRSDSTALGTTSADRAEGG